MFLIFGLFGGFFVVLELLFVGFIFMFGIVFIDFVEFVCRIVEVFFG